MTSVLVIPGVGVRGAGIDEYFAKLSAHLNRMRPGDTLHACRWGAAVGANLLAGGISVPGAELDYPPLETATSESLANAATRMEPAFGSLLVQALAQRKSATAQALADQDGVVHDPRQLHVQLWELLDSDPCWSWRRSPTATRTARYPAPHQNPRRDRAAANPGTQVTWRGCWVPGWNRIPS